MISELQIDRWFGPDFNFVEENGILNLRPSWSVWSLLIYTGFGIDRQYRNYIYKNSGANSVKISWHWSCRQHFFFFNFCLKTLRRKIESGSILKHQSPPYKKKNSRPGGHPLSQVNIRGRVARWSTKETHYWLVLVKYSVTLPFT